MSISTHSQEAVYWRSGFIPPRSVKEGTGASCYFKLSSFSFQNLLKQIHNKLKPPYQGFYQYGGVRVHLSSSEL